ncbi:biofilm PGA synthesis PgaC-like N-glycosyltransferase [Thermococcus barophilus MP]|uniref:Biofilm PGA synthesis PgaC-like N-glycosyltransferase n=2 Tax=Thermococcus barophilus TaxID=55802 RepID=F0LLT7_THEBM|nr:biofilm PGA synthesis PgaC-like N-glycosyltransferase [Thermococcus barophilus MP]
MYFPRISIGIPVYNEQENIQKLLLSILCQKGVNIREIIIINDGSTDNTLKKIMEISSIIERDIVLKVINLRHNIGKANALNIIFRIASSEYLVLLDSDVILMDEYTLKRLVYPLIKNEDIGLVSGWYEISSYSSINMSVFNKIITWAYKFSAKLLKEIGSNFGVYGATGAIMAVPRNIYKELQLPTNMLRDDLYVYLDVLSKNKKFVFQPNAKVIVHINPTLKNYLRYQVRVRSIPKDIIIGFGNIAQEELRKPPYSMLLLTLLRLSIKYPLEGISWVLLKVISLIYIKYLKNIKISVRWRARKEGINE